MEIAKPRLVVCPVCRAQLRESNLPRHMARVHRGVGALEPLTAFAGPRPTEPSPPPHDPAHAAIRAGLVGGRSCTCGGSNENCSRCYGTGQIQPIGGGRTGVVPHEVAPASHKSPSAFNGAFGGLYVAGGAAASAGQPQRRRRRTLGAAPLTPTNARRGPEPINESRRPLQPGMVVCGVCHANVLEKNLAKHRRKMHGSQSVPPKQKTLAPSSTSVRADHPRGPRTPCPGVGRTTNTSRKYVGAPNSGADRGDIDHLRFERRVDGSRGLHEARDHGQFGSHPVHDDHGDESEP
jgi:hypothetical protein